MDKIENTLCLIDCNLSRWIGLLDILMNINSHSFAIVRAGVV